MTAQHAADPQPSPADGGPTVNQQPPSFEISHQGSISLFRPRPRDARQWLNTHCPAGDDHTYYSGALVVEYRYVADLALLAREAGLLV